MQASQDKDGFDGRRYLRLNTVFPVGLEVVSLDDKETYSELCQAFTRDVSEGGMCLEINNLKDDLADKLSKKSAKLRLQIDTPFSSKPIAAIAEASWVKKTKEQHPNKYLIGVSYEKISEQERRRIINYGRLLLAKPILTVLAVIILIVAVVITRVELERKEVLRKEAEKRIALIEDEKLKLSALLKEAIASRSGLEAKFRRSEAERINLENKLEAARAEAQAKPEEIAKLEAELVEVKGRSEELSKELAKIAAEKKSLEDQLGALEEIKASKPVKVTLAAGGVVVGKVVLETENSIRVEVPTGVITLKRELISSMSVPSEAELADLARERLALEKRAVEVERQKEIDRLEAAERNKAEKAMPKKEAVEPKISISKRISERGVVIKNGRIYADGSLFFIKGVAYGISAPGLQPGVNSCFSKIPISVFENDFRMMKEAGVNTIRAYEPLPDALLDLAEKYGLKVIEQVAYPLGSTDYSSDYQLDALKLKAVETVKRHKNRKCILMWSIWNDAPFNYSNSGNVVPRYGFEKVNNFMREIYNAVKAADKSHPVTAANILKVDGHKLGFDFLDVIGCNAYIGGHGFSWRGKEEAAKTVAEMKKISEEYKKPVFIAETGYSTFVKNDSQDKAIRTQIESIGCDLSGIVIFEWTDEWWKAGNTSVQDKDIEEYWGILTWDRKPKPGFAIVSKFFRSIPTESLGYSSPDSGKE